MEEILELIRKYTGHDNIFLTARGNAAIWVALKTVSLLKQGPILVQDQGGWKTFLEYPERLGLRTVQVKTGYGVIDLHDLEEKAKRAAALIYANPSGYCAGQPFHEIYEICKRNGCFVIMDISGCISDEYMYTADAADFFVCSFGKWKVANAGYGGFISARSKGFVGRLKEVIDAARLENPAIYSFDAQQQEKVIAALQKAPERLAALYKEVGKVKYELDGFDIIHKDKMGIVVIVKYEDDTVKQQLIDYCKRNGYEYSECPRYIRVNENAISVEIKRLDL
ncbi:hypothetical protein HYV81_01370 [Candidatus Woesearchaeota archaeon]|nr:hypothetical protein [Candidatus Woesearchaeota archaeon]